MDSKPQTEMPEGWTFSPAHGGYINESHRRQGTGWDSYIVADDTQEAREISGEDQ